MGFFIVQRVPLPIPYHLSKYYSKHSLYDRVKRLPEILWTPRCYSQLDTFDARSLQEVDWVLYGVSVKATNMFHESVGCGSFFDQSFGANERVR